MSVRRIVGVVLVVLSVGVPVDMLACGDKFLGAGRGNPLQRSKSGRPASVLIFVSSSAMAATIKKAKTESLLNGEFHSTLRVQTLQELSNSVSGGRYDVILTANGDAAEVRNLVQASADPPFVVAVDDLKNSSILRTIDKVVMQRDQSRKKPTKR